MKSVVAFIKKDSFNGKITSRTLWFSLLRYKSKTVEVKRFSGAEEFDDWLKKRSDSYYKIIVIPIYCEDQDSPKKNKIELAIQVKNVSRSYKNVFVYHGPRLGNILGNKSKTNRFMTSRGIRCPKLITSRNYTGPVFVNEKSASHGNTKVLINGKKIDRKKYNTALIDTSFEYNGERYHASTRVMCIEGRIIDIHLRFRNAKENNPNVHGGDTPFDPELQNFYYETKIKPNIKKLKRFCKKIGDNIKLGFYAHDLLLCNKTNEFYLAESAFKFDNILMWKNYLNGKFKPNTPNILHLIKHEKPVNKYVKDAVRIFYKIVETKYL
jgi:hypothetical protein